MSDARMMVKCFGSGEKDFVILYRQFLKL